jgi:leucyl aminopeptidase
MAWNLAARPGRPKGGEAMGLRALFDYINMLAAE